MRSTVAILALALALPIATQTLAAHHSFAAEFDANKPFTFSGTVTRIEWMNPHTYFYIDVVDEQTGAKTNWAMEMGSPNVLARNGWTRNSLKVGDVVTVEGSLARDGSMTANARAVILAASGRRLFTGPTGRIPY